MKFSVLIPVYNVEKFIEECLDSVLSQTFTDFEMILVDDGSTDSSGEICDSYALKDERIRVIHKENQGLISARRVGIREAKGDFCVFVDSDDKVKPELLSTLNYYIEKFNSDMVLYTFAYYDGKETKSRDKQLFGDGRLFEGDSKKELYEEFIAGPNYYAIWTKCIETCILKSDPINYAEYYSFNMSEDVLQSIYPLTKAERIVFADKELYLYRYNPGSISHSMSADTIYKKNTSHVFALMRAYLRKWKIDDSEHIKKLEAAQFGYAMYTFSEYYKAAKKHDRKKVVDFNWDSFLSSEFKPNEYCSELHKWFYECIKEKNYGEIERFFRKQQIYKKLQKIKRKL